MAQIELMDEAPAAPSPRPRMPWWLTTIVILGSILTVLGGTGIVMFYGLSARYDSRVERQDILQGLPKAEVKAGVGMNFLVLGSDSRSGTDTQSLDETGSRSDTIMVVHVKADRTGALIFSIPRDSYVNIPAGGSWPGGKNKINAALAFGGANLAAKAVYELTGLPLNGAMIVNFTGVHKMVEAVGGVNVCVGHTVTSYHTGRVWQPGCQEMGPEESADFMRQRMSVPGGDFGRIKNQQSVIKGLLQKIVSGGVLTNPIKLDSLLTTAADSLTVDKDLDLRALAFEVSNIKPNNVVFATVPYLGTMTTDAGSSVQLDMDGAAELFAAVRDERIDEWLANHPQSASDSF